MSNQGVVDNDDDDDNQIKEDVGGDSVRTASTTVASLWTSHQTHRRLLQKHFSDENGGLLDGRVEGGDDGAGATFHPPSTSFCRLNVATNLNPPPSNWLMSGAQGHVPPGVDQLSGFDPSNHSTGFSSFRMASHFLECLGCGVDVVSDAENIKKLLRMPYSKNAVSMVVHRIGKTLLIDELDLHRILLSSLDEERQWLRKFFIETILDLLESDSDKPLLVRRNKSRDAIVERNLISKFLYRSLNPPNGEAHSEEQHKTEDEPPQASESELLARNLGFNLPPLPEPSPEDFEPKFVPSNHEFARTLLWNFEDIRMLIGSDMPIFGDADHPSVSLRLHNMQRPINILTGLDYWLDNLMCQVPEVLMCYHLDGIVQKYELIKTEELPKLGTDCKFSPGIIRDVAKNILAFLKSNAAKEGHTYWLFKAKDDDVVKLYDLTSLCEEVDGQKKTESPSSSGTSSSSSKPSESRSKEQHDKSSSNTTTGSEAMQNPFRTAVSMLLYKVARNILNSNARREDEASARQLLVKCLELLDKDKFPHIATSAHYMLSDIYIPDGIDPSSVTAEDYPSTDPEKNMETPASSTQPKLRKFDKKRKLSCTAATSSTPSTAMVAIQALMSGDDTSKKSAKNATDDDDKDGDLFAAPSPPPISESVRERCGTALDHIVSGLAFLEVLSSRRDEKKASEIKSQEQHERDHPKMAKPHVPIPMPFAPSNETERRLAVQPPTELALHQGSSASDTSLTKRSWYDHLKIVLLRKAFLVYVTLAETHFLKRFFGKALRCIKRALNCRIMVRQLEENILDPDCNSTLSFAYGIAGDSYMALVQNWSSNIVDYIDQYNACETKAEADLADRIEHHVEEERRDWLIRLPCDIEESLKLSMQCLTKALECVEVEAIDHDNLLRRLANVCNELGVFYMNQASSLSRQFEDENLTPAVTSEILLKSQRHLEDGVKHFATLRDAENQALLLSNFGRLNRIKAFCLSCHNDSDGAKDSQSEDSDELTEKEVNLYLEAISCYKKALSVLGKRKNSDIHDKVSWELSTTHYNLACQLQDKAPLSRKSRPDLARSVADHFAAALKYCEVENTGGREEKDEARVPILQYRAGSIHGRLATLYHHCLRYGAAENAPQSNFVKNVQLYRQMAESHYDKASTLYSTVEDHGELIRCLLEHISLQEFQMEESHPSKKNFLKVLSLFVQALPTLKALRAKFLEAKCTSVASAGDDGPETEKLLHLFVQRCQQNLLALNRFLSANSSSTATASSSIPKTAKAVKGTKPTDWAKKLYSQALLLPGSHSPNYLSELISLVENMSRDLNTWG